jgi:Zn-dependent peptidase ImmA (M78 family)
MPPRFTLARRRAAELLTEGQIKKAPIPVERLAELVNATVRYEPLAGDQLSGMVHRRKDGRAVIGVNSLDPPTRRRFTIAHEIGHLILHKNEQFHVDEKFPIGLRNEVSSLAVDEKEIEANQFAAELLMPSDLIAKDIEELPSDIETEDAISRLARHYQVSIQAMTIRLSTLGILA